MVVPGQERGLEAAHAVPADQGIGERDLERVAGVQRAGDVRRRVRDDEGLTAASGLRVVEAFLLPRSLPALLDAGGLVQRLHSGKFTRTWASSFTRSRSSEISSPTWAGSRWQSRSRCSSRSSSCGRSPGATSSRPRTRTPRSPVDPCFGAYLAGVGVNSIVPGRAGDLVKIYLVHRRVEETTYTTLASTPCHGDAARPGARARDLPLGIDPGCAPEPGRPAEPALLRLDVAPGTNEGERRGVCAAGNRCDRVRVVGLTARRALQAAGRSRLLDPSRPRALRCARSRAGSCSAGCSGSARSTSS